MEKKVIQENTCQKCGSPLIKRTVREEYFYSDKSLYIDAFLLHCNECGKEIDLNADERPKEKKRFELSVDGFLTDEDIKRIRKKLGLTQKKMAEKLGVGEKNFARYENLSVRQSKAMDNLLRILDVYPEAIGFLEVNEQPKLQRKLQ